MEGGSARTSDGPALLRLGGRLSGQTAIYASSSIATFFFAMVGVAVLTRLLTLEEYGRLALYYLFAGFLNPPPPAP